ncbi:MAG TPA: hypothetical protein VKQ72_06500, partial [Aggregatilineales bacterium]|nr:hypothetical protein [Aggregatilineales bacterium]
MLHKQLAFLAQFWLRFCGTVLISGSIVAGFVFTPRLWRHLTGDPGCLNYDPGPNYYLSMFDLRTGQHAFSSVLSSQTNPFKQYEPYGPAMLQGATMYPPLGYYYNDYGPSEISKKSLTGRYVATLYDNFDYRIPLGFSVEGPSGGKTKLADVPNGDIIAWTPHDKLIYVDSDSAIVEGDPQTGEKRSILPPYTSFSVPSPNGEYLIVWNADDSSIKVIPTDPLYNDDPAVLASWQSFQINNGWIRWSPNSQYYAVLYFPDGGGGGGGFSPVSTPLDIVGVNGKVFRKVTTLTSRQSAGGEPILDARWSADGKTMLYREADPTSSLNDLIAFDPQTGGRQVIERNIVSTLSFSFENMPFYDYSTPDQERIAL